MRSIAILCSGGDDMSVNNYPKWIIFQTKVSSTETSTKRRKSICEA